MRAAYSKRFYSQTLVPTGLVVAIVSSAAVAEISNSFDSNIEGWRVVDYPFRSHRPNPSTAAATFDPGVGNPPGSLRIGDIYAETGVAAPAAYLGDQFACYGGTLSYDIFLRYTDGVAYPAVVLNAGTMSLYYDTPSPPLDAWSSRTIPLIETGWRVSGSQKPATIADFIFVLTNLQGLYIYTEWHTGADDTSLDNVKLNEGACSFIPDYDHDCDVDDHDFLWFEWCATGPGFGPVSPLCQGADLDNDSDVDQADFAFFQRCLSGENVPADPECAE